MNLNSQVIEAEAKLTMNLMLYKFCPILLKENDPDLSKIKHRLTDAIQQDWIFLTNAFSEYKTEREEDDGKCI